MTGADTPEAPEPVVLRVVRGEPDATELAAVVAVLATSSGSNTVGPAAKRSMWAARSRQVRPPLHPSPGAWRASTLPR